MAQDNETFSINYALRRQARRSEPPKQERPWRRRLVGGGAALVCILAVGAALLLGHSRLYVSVVRAEVRAAVVNLAPQVDGFLHQLHVQPGQHVTKGQLLLRLDTLDRKSMTSPVKGTVLEIRHRVGEFCSRGQTTVRLLDRSEDLWVEGYVSVADAARLKPGQTARLAVAGPGNRLDAELVAIWPTVTDPDMENAGGAAPDPGPGRKQFVRVKLRLIEQPPDLRPGSSVTGAIRVR